MFDVASPGGLLIQGMELSDADVYELIGLGFRLRAVSADQGPRIDARTKRSILRFLIRVWRS